MTTNRMGLTPEMALEISNERIDDETLAELIDFRRSSLDYHIKQGYKTQAFMHGVVLSALRELLAYRKAISEPVADVVAWHHPSHERTCDIRWRRFDVAPGPLFAAPPLQTGTVPDGWIKCSEKIPEEEEQYYLTYSDGVGVCRSYFFDGYFADQHITHWMPLALPPVSVTNEP